MTHALESLNVSSWNNNHSHVLQNHACNSLEQGSILFFPELKFLLKPEEQRFLSPNYTDGKAKNISFDRRTDQLQGVQCTADEYPQLKEMLYRFSTHAEQLLTQFIPRYTTALQIGRTSYRPIEIKGRISPSYRKDDTRLHVDAFPANPNQGRRIIRVFSNINPHAQSRVWRVGEPFEQVALTFLPKIKKPIFGSHRLLHTLGITKSLRTDYDHMMLNIHDTMKGDLNYQQNCQQEQLLLSAGSTWIVQTDHVSHAALEGQYVLEQTFYLPVAAMQDESHSPLRVLERLSKRKLI